MISREGRNTAALNFFMASGTVGLLAASACLFASATWLNKINAEPSVKFDPKPWSWLSELKFGLDRIEVQDLPQAPIHVASVVPVAPVISVQPIKRSVVAKVHRKLRKLPKVVPAPVEVIEEIAEMPSFENPVLEDKVQVVTAATVSSQDASLDEMATMQMMHISLRSRFKIAMRPTPVQVAPVTTQPVLVVASTPSVIRPRKLPLTTHPKRSVWKAPSRKGKRFATSRIVAQAKPLVEIPKVELKPVQAAPVATVATVDLPQFKPVPEMDTQKILDSVRVAMAAPVSEEIMGDVPRAQMILDTPRPEPPPVAPTQTAQVEAPMKKEAAPLVPAPLIVAANPMIGYPSKNDYPAGMRVEGWNAPVKPAPVTTQTPVTIQPAAQTKTSIAAVTFNAKPPLKATFAPAIGTRYVEALNWEETISDGASETLTKETSDLLADARGWSIGKAAAHIPSLYWKAGSPFKGTLVPLLSNNTIRMLAALGSVNIQDEAGIVFGKIPSGWTVEFSGRSESGIFLNEKNLSVALESDGDKYFVFLNSAPGAHLIYLTSSDGKSSGAIGIPVLGGNATFADLSAITKTSVSGIVLDGSSSEQKGLKQIGVRIVGQPGAITLSAASGEFKMTEVMTVSDYPLFFETTTPKGFTHRYKIAVDQLSHLTLYRLKDEQINTWISQLEGGVSSESGLVVAAVPSVIEKNQNETLFPSVRSLSRYSTLTPETYTLSENGQMMVNTPVTANTSRFVSVQVPEGPVMALVENKAQSVIWSEMIMSSPGVVSLVGPY